MVTVIQVRTPKPVRSTGSRYAAPPMAWGRLHAPCGEISKSLLNSVRREIRRTRPLACEPAQVLGAQIAAGQDGRQSISSQIVHPDRGQTRSA
jgi:hypothetical protein